jgi:pyruvate dehydrogenase E2 component (dihydrolipoamide acetyltransferase)
MEALSPTMEEGQIVKWLKAEGDTVANGEILAEIETDKATMELVARGDGILRRIFLEEGGTTPVGEVIGVIAGADEDISDLADAGDAAAPSPPAEVEEATDVGEPQAPSPGEKAAPEALPSQPSPTIATQPPSGRGKSSPVARRLAQEAGVDVASLPGSGPGGRVVKRDVEAAVARGGSGPVALPPGVPGVEYEDIQLNQMRKTIARRLTESLGPVPHFFLTIDVDMERALEARGEINRVLEAQREKVSINDLLIRATAAALKRHPACNAAWLGDTIRRFNRVHIGVAVAVDDGLITPVVRDADLKGVAQIAREVREMAVRGREKKLQPEEYTGSTFSISNLGMYGIYEFTGVINPPEGGILAVGSVEERPVVVDGEVVPRHRMRITMSCDHRVIDGATGAAFLATLKAMLEEPATILI